MSIALPRPPPAMGTRPAYLDGLFTQQPPSPSLHSSSSSISCTSTVSSNSDSRSMPFNSHTFSPTRPLSPAFEEGFDDSRSISSFRTFSSKFSFRSLLHRPSKSKRGGYRPQYSSMGCAPSKDDLSHYSGVPASRRPSLGKIQTLSPTRKASTAQLISKPLPIEPTEPAQELSCHRCYYFAARNCHGWVLGGSNGDACETCLRAGFFGAP